MNIYPWPIAQGDAPDLSPYKPEMQDDIRAKSTDLGVIELPSHLVARIRREALPIEKLASWKKNVLLLEAATVRTECEQIYLTDLRL